MLALHRLQAGSDFSHKRVDLSLLWPDGRLLDKHQEFANSWSGYQQAKAHLLQHLAEAGLDGLDYGRPGQHDEDSHKPHQTVQHMLRAFPFEPHSILLFVADGLSCDAKDLVDQLRERISHARPPDGSPTASLAVAGCLAQGDASLQQSAQIGGLQTGSAGLAAALITGKIALGVGTGHGWFPVGASFHVSGSTGRWIETLDEQPAIQTYARLFGQEPQAWMSPPLNDMVRLYPLGIETKGAILPGSNDYSYLVRTPQRFEEDGSLRMITSVSQGSDVHLLVGSPETCLASAHAAVSQAQEALTLSGGQLKPILALAWVDASYRKMLEAQPGSEFDAIRSVLGPEVPLLGAYTLGQIACTPPDGIPELLNGHIQILLFGQPAG